MSRAASTVLTMIVAALLIRISLTGEHARYVRAGMGPWLLAAGVVLALTTALVVVGERTTDHQSHVHSGPRVGWLLLALVLVLFVVAPGALGSYSLDRTTRVDIGRGAPSFAPMDPQTEPVAISLLEFSQRAFDGGAESFRNNTLQLTGFIAPAKGGGFTLARYRISCCAADAQATIVRVVGVDKPAKNDAWVTVDGTFDGTSGATAVLLAERVRVVTTPDEPYE